MDSLNQLRQALKKCKNTKTLIVCIGNTLKGDDGAGPVIFEKLRGKISIDLIDAGTVPENYIEPIIKKAPSNLIIIDAADFGSPAGTVKILNPAELQSVSISTHTVSPALFLERITSRIDTNIIFIGIQSKQLSLGNGLSQEVKESVDILEKLFVEVFGK